MLGLERSLSSPPRGANLRGVGDGIGRSSSASALCLDAEGMLVVPDIISAPPTIVDFNNVIVNIDEETYGEVIIHPEGDNKFVLEEPKTTTTATEASENYHDFDDIDAKYLDL